MWCILKQLFTSVSVKVVYIYLHLPILLANVHDNVMQDLFFSELFNRWFLFEKVIEALLAQDIFHRSLKQLQYYAEKECFIEDADDFAAMISFYHDLGMIIKHRETVVLKAQWLIDLLKQLITIPHYNKMVGKIYFIYIRSVSLEIEILEILYTPWPSHHHLTPLSYSFICV